MRFFWIEEPAPCRTAAGWPAYLENSKWGKSPSGTASPVGRTGPVRVPHDQQDIKMMTLDMTLLSR